MAVTSFPLNHPLAIKLWSKRLMREALRETYVSRFFGTSKDSLIYVKDELNKSAGDRIRVGLRMQLSGTGVVGDNTLEGNEEALTTHTDNLFIDQLRHAVNQNVRRFSGLIAGTSVMFRAIMGHDRQSAAKLQNLPEMRAI